MRVFASYEAKRLLYLSHRSRSFLPSDSRTNTSSAAALLVPVFAAVAEQMNLPKEVLVLVIGIGASCAFMLPVATPPNALVMGTGEIKSKDMFVAGLVLNFVSIVVVALFAYYFILK